MSKTKLISPLVSYMQENRMVCDDTNPISEQSTQVQFTFTASGTNQLRIWKPYFFPTNPSLNGSVIKGIQPIAQSTLALAPDGSPLVAADLFAKAMIWLVNANDDVLVNMPLFDLRGERSGNGYAKIQRFELKDIVWQKCYLTLHDTTGFNVGDSILFNIYYTPEELKDLKNAKS